MGDDRLETERRRATVIFADITDFTPLVQELGDEEAWQVVTDCLVLLERAARKYGAVVHRFQGDCVLAVFGAPRAMEETAKAAVNAAIEMRGEVARLNRRRPRAPALRIHAGINSGPLVFGDIVGPSRQEDTVLGTTVNVAARLRDLSPAGEVWVGQATWEATRHEFAFDALEPRPLKGTKGLTPIYALRAQAPRIHRTPGFARSEGYVDLVGRFEELGALRAALAEAAAGEGRIVFVSGEPGLGKSRLLAELAETPEAAATHWLLGRSLSIGTNLSHHPFQDLFRSWLELGGDESEQEAREALDREVERLLPEDAAEIAPLLANLMGARVDPQERDRIQGVQADVLETRTRSAIVRVLAALAAERPLSLVFEDLHWADRSSIEVVELLLPVVDSAPIALFAVTRPGFEATSGRIEALARERHAGSLRRVALHPLAPKDAHELVERLLGDGDVPHATRHAIREKTGGNPLFAQDVVRSLVDRGALQRRDDRLVATERLSQVPIPTTIEEVILSRIDALPTPRRRLVQYASVIGGVFHVPILARVLSKDDLEDPLAELETAGLLRRLGDARAEFTHPLLQEVAYTTLVRRDREGIHRQVGEAMQTLLTENVPGFDAMLAYHFVRGGDLERGEEYLLRAGSRAAASAASNEALHFFQAAAAVYAEQHGDGGDPEVRARLEKNVALAFFNRGRLAEAVEHFDAALAHLGDRLPRGRARMAGHFAFDLAAVLARLYLPGRGRRLPAASDRQREIIATRFDRALAQTTTAPEFLYDTLSTLHLLSRVDLETVPESGGILAGAVGVFSYGGVSFGVSRRVLGIARELRERGNVQKLLLYHHLMHFIHGFLEGSWGDDLAIDESLLEDGLRQGRLWEVAIGLDMDARWRFCRGEFGAARRRAAELEQLARDYEHEYAWSAHRSLRALLALERGDPAEAAAWLEEYQREHGEHSFQVVALGTRAQAELDAGDPEAAERSLASAEAVLAQAGLLLPFHRSFYAIPRLRSDVEWLDRARAGGAGGASPTDVRRRSRSSRRRALAIAARVAPRRSEALRLAAVHDWVRGRYRPALAGFANALDTGRALGARPELARTCLEIARRLDEPYGPEVLEGRDAASYRDEGRRLQAELEGES